MSTSARTLSALLSISLGFVIGCGYDPAIHVATTAAHLSGTVHGGQQPISGSTVTVWKAGDVNYGSLATALASTTSLSDGTFDIPAGSYACDTPTTQVYITAQGGASTPGYTNNFIMLAAGLGNCSILDNQQVEINEVSTVVTAFALSQFFGIHGIPGGPVSDNFGAPASNMSAMTLSNTYTIPTLLNVANGLVNPNTSTVTIDAAKIYSLADVLAACVNTTPASGNQTCLDLISDAPGAINAEFIPNDTLQVAVNIALYPYANVASLYGLGTPTSPFVGLGAVPNDWTIGVSYTTPTMGLSILGTETTETSSNIDIDTNGRIWFPSNLPGKTGIGYFDPAATTFTGPLNATGVTLTQPQYVAIDPFGYAWVTDSLSNQLEVIDTTGATAAMGGPITAASTLGPVAIDPSGDAYVGYTDISGNPNFGNVDTATNTFQSTAAFIDNPTGMIWVNFSTYDAIFASTSGSGTGCNGEEYDFTTPPVLQLDVSSTPACLSGGVAIAQENIDGLIVASSGNQICSATYGCGFITQSGVPVDLPEGIATDGSGSEWVANSGNASVTTFAPVTVGYAETSNVFYQHGPSDGNTMTRPYGIAIDGSGNVWVSNATCVTDPATVCTPGAFVLSELIGAATPTITPLVNQNGGLYAGYEPGNQPVPSVKSQPVSDSNSKRTWSRHHSSASPAQPRPTDSGAPIAWLTPRVR